MASRQFSTEDDDQSKPQTKTERRILFDRPYASPPKVIVWLNQLDMAHNKNWRVEATATDVTADGFTIHLDTWSDSVLFSATAAWIAHPSSKAGVTSGSYNTTDVRGLYPPRLRTEGRVDFPAGTFTATPTVLVAFNKLDVDCVNNLRAKLSAESVSQCGMNWHIYGWSNTQLYSAGASYIAFA